MNKDSNSALNSRLNMQLTVKKPRTYEAYLRLVSNFFKSLKRSWTWQVAVFVHILTLNVNHSNSSMPTIMVTSLKRRIWKHSHLWMEKTTNLFKIHQRFPMTHLQCSQQVVLQIQIVQASINQIWVLYSNDQLHTLNLIFRVMHSKDKVTDRWK